MFNLRSQCVNPLKTVLTPTTVALTADSKYAEKSGTLARKTLLISSELSLAGFISQIGNFVISRRRLNITLYSQIIASYAASELTSGEGDIHSAEAQTAKADLIDDHGLSFLVRHLHRRVQKSMGVAAQNDVDVARSCRQLDIVHFVFPILVAKVTQTDDQVAFLFVA